MYDTIILNKNGTFTTMNSEKLTEDILDKAKFLLFENFTGTRSNTFVPVKKKHASLENYHIEALITYIFWYNEDNTYYELEKKINATNLPQKYSISTVISQAPSLLIDVPELIGASGIQIIVGLTNHDTHQEWAFDSDEDDLLSNIKSTGLYFDTFSIFYKSDDRLDEHYLVLSENNTWELVVSEDLEYYIEEVSFTPDAVAYIGIPSVTCELLTIISLDEFNLLDYVYDISAYVTMSDYGSPYTYVTEISFNQSDIDESHTVYHVNEMLSDVIMIPQISRIIDLQPRLTFHYCNIYVNFKVDSLPDHINGDTITITLERDDLWRDDIQLLPVILSAIWNRFSEGGDIEYE